MRGPKKARWAVPERGCEIVRVQLLSHGSDLNQGKAKRRSSPWRIPSMSVFNGRSHSDSRPRLPTGSVVWTSMGSQARHGLDHRLAGMPAHVASVALWPCARESGVVVVPQARFIVGSWGCVGWTSGSCLDEDPLSRRR